MLIESTLKTRRCIADLFNTTLILRKRHFTYRLIAVQKALLREERARCKAGISASHAEGLRERRGRGPACTSPEQTEYSNNYPRFGRANRISTIRLEVYNGFTHFTRVFSKSCNDRRAQTTNVDSDCV